MPAAVEVAPPAAVRTDALVQRDAVVPPAGGLVAAWLGTCVGLGSGLGWGVICPVGAGGLLLLEAPCVRGAPLLRVEDLRLQGHNSQDSTLQRLVRLKLELLSHLQHGRVRPHMGLDSQPELGVHANEDSPCPEHMRQVCDGDLVQILLLFLEEKERICERSLLGDTEQPLKVPL